MNLVAWLRMFFSFPDGFTESWRQRREKAYKRSKPTYDAYPGRSHRPKVRLVMISGKHWEPVDTEGYDLNEINWKLEWRQRWLINKFLEAFVRINVRIDHEKEIKDEAIHHRSSLIE